VSQKPQQNPIQSSFSASPYRHSGPEPESRKPATKQSQKTKTKQFQSLGGSKKTPHIFLFKNEPIPPCGKRQYPGTKNPTQPQRPKGHNNHIHHKKEQKGIYSILGKKSKLYSRQTHNLKVVGSNPTPPRNQINPLKCNNFLGFFYVCILPEILCRNSMGIFEMVIKYDLI
jgi:hypothetical protein